MSDSVRSKLDNKRAVLTRWVPVRVCDVLKPEIPPHHMILRDAPTQTNFLGGLLVFGFKGKMLTYFRLLLLLVRCGPSTLVGNWCHRFLLTLLIRSEYKQYDMMLKKKKKKRICSAFIFFSCPIGAKKKLKNGDIKTRPPDKTESVKHQYLRLNCNSTLFSKTVWLLPDHPARPFTWNWCDEPGCDILNHIKVY